MLKNRATRSGRMGRPPLPAGDKFLVQAIRFQQWAIDAMKAEAEKAGLPWAEWARKRLQRGLKKPPAS